MGFLTTKGLITARCGPFSSIDSHLGAARVAGVWWAVRPLPRCRGTRNRRGFLVPWNLLWNQLGWSNGFQIFRNWRTSIVAVFWDQICRVQHCFGKRNAKGKDFEMQRLGYGSSGSWLIEPSSQQGALATLHSAREQATWMNLGNAEWCLLDVVLQNIPKRRGLILYIIVSFVISWYFSNRVTPTYHTLVLP